MMAYYDVMCFLEYYADRTDVLDPITDKRTPTNSWQNFYQESQQLSTIDNEIADNDFLYLAFDVDGFGSTEAGSINDLSVTLAAVENLVDATDLAMAGNSLVIASLIIQDSDQDNLDPGSAQVISRYIGSIASATINDTAISWSINPAIDKQKAQVPSRKIASDLMGRFVGQ